MLQHYAPYGIHITWANGLCACASFKPAPPMCVVCAVTFIGGGKRQFEDSQSSLLFSVLELVAQSIQQLHTCVACKIIKCSRVWYLWVSHSGCCSYSTMEVNTGHCLFVVYSVALVFARSAAAEDQWSGLVNGFTEDFTYNCPDDLAVSGVASVFRSVLLWGGGRGSTVTQLHGWWNHEGHGGQKTMALSPDFRLMIFAPLPHILDFMVLPPPPPYFRLMVFALPPEFRLMVFGPPRFHSTCCLVVVP